MLVIEKLEPTFAQTSKRFLKITLTLAQLVPIALQQITSLEHIHSKGFVHKGVKPDNFVMSKDHSQVFIIDFNVSKKFLSSDGRHVPFQEDNKAPRGLPLFHSLNHHNGLKCSRRDDMESLAFCWVYWLTGKLPWSRIEKKDKKWKIYVSEIGQSVRDTTPQELFKEFPLNARNNFIEYFESCRKLNFEDKPNYEEMRRLIATSLDANNNTI